MVPIHVDAGRRTIFMFFTCTSSVKKKLKFHFLASCNEQYIMQQIKNIHVDTKNKNKKIRDCCCDKTRTNNTNLFKHEVTIYMTWTIWNMHSHYTFKESKMEKLTWKFIFTITSIFIYLYIVGDMSHVLSLVSTKI